MAKYDMNSTFSDSYKLTLSELCHELMDEYEAETGNEPKGEETYRNKFKNHDRSGILDKLKDKLQLDLEKIAINDRERFNMLKILKQLYYIEKSGEPKNKLTLDQNVRIPIIDILAKPVLDNVFTCDNSQSEYGDIILGVLMQLEEVIPDARERYSTLQNINNDWETIGFKMFNYILTDKSFSNPEVATAELKRINSFLRDKILVKLRKLDPEKYLKPEGVMTTYYTVIRTCWLMSYASDRINIINSIPIETNIDDRWIDFYQKYGRKKYTLKTLVDDFKQGLCTGNFSEPAKLLYNLVTYGKPIDDCEMKHYKYAIEHIYTIIDCMKSIGRTDLSHGLYIGTIASIIQVIVYNKKNNTKIPNSYFGYKNRYLSLMSVIRSKDHVKRIIQEAWLTCIENQVAINFGASGMISEKRKIDNSLFEIKKIIYSYKNLKSMKYVSDFLLEYVDCNLVSSEFVKTQSVNFINAIVNKLSKPAKKIIPSLNTSLAQANNSVMYLFKHPLVINSNSLPDLADKVAQVLNAFYEDNDDPALIMYNFKKNLKVEYKHQTYLFRYKFFVDKSKHIFRHLYFYKFYPDRRQEQIVEVGLEDFILRKIDGLNGLNGYIVVNL